MDDTPSTILSAEEPSPPEVAPPEVADGRLKPVDPRWVEAEQVSWVIFNAIVTVAAMVMSAIAIVVDWFPTWVDLTIIPIAFALIVVLWWLGVRVPHWMFARTRYAVSHDGIEIRRGLLWRTVINVPRSRVQHTDVLQGPIGRRFGIAKLTIYTAGTAYASVGLDGLEHATALQIRDFLIRGGDEDAV